jgi:hypothetical protein
MNRTTLLYYTLTKQKMKWFHSNYQTQNKLTSFSETEIEPLHSDWLSNQTHPKRTNDHGRFQIRCVLNLEVLLVATFLLEKWYLKGK